MAEKAKPAPPPQPKKQEECQCEEGLPAWLATFADLMSLLLTFFVLLLSFANMDIVKFKDMMGSIKDAFGVQIKRREFDQIAFSPTSFERSEVKMEKQEKQILAMVLRVKAVVDQNQEIKKDVQVSPEDQGVLMRVDTALMFPPGSAKLKPGADRVLKDVVRILKEQNYDVVVRGHTDDRPTRSSVYPSNWELSAARAAATLRYLIDKGISPTRLKAVGYADTHPLVPNTSEANRSINRRVEFYYHRPKIEGW